MRFRKHTPILILVLLLAPHVGPAQQAVELTGTSPSPLAAVATNSGASQALQEVIRELR